jgi:outer membrane protein assembly factor BamA
MKVNARHTKSFFEIWKMNVSKITLNGVGLRTHLLLLFALLSASATAQYTLAIVAADKDSSFLSNQLQLQYSFSNQSACVQYVNGLAALLQQKGYAAASVDSTVIDSLFTRAFVYIGTLYKIQAIEIDSAAKQTLQSIGEMPTKLIHHPFQPIQLRAWQERLLDYFENHGYPFVKIQVDSLTFNSDSVSLRLQLNKGPLYSVDSIRVYGDVSISNNFLQRYLDLKNGSEYEKKKLQNISKRILELPYLQQQQNWDITLLGTGAIVNLYLKPKKSNQINVLVGLLPANQSTNNIYEQQVRAKLLLTGEANINLRNAFGNGETMGLNWQQLQQKSPRLNLYFQQPYLFGSPFGITTSFNLYKKDSAFLNLNFLLGLQYAFSIHQTSKVFIQALQSNLGSLDTLKIKEQRSLPNDVDVRSVNVGIDYDFNKTNYRLNPRKGSEFSIVASVGTRTIKKNNIIVKLADANYKFATLYDSIKLNSYQFKIKSAAAHYFPLTKLSTLKTAVSGGWFQSPTIFRNELFQIGGYRLMRGFDEESIFASSYAVGTVEYRYLVGLNSFFFVFTDYGWIENKTFNLTVSNTFIGAGLGLALETKAGIFNMSYASGKRNDLKFDIRQSKIHIGYVSYF